MKHVPSWENIRAWSVWDSGCKESRGILTEEFSLRVYVHRKKPLADVRQGDRVPAFYRGVATDVLEAGRGVRTSACEDTAKYPVVIGGITVTTGKLVGTLGFLATIDGLEGPDNIALVTNAHVLAANQSKIGDTVYQPDSTKTLPNNSIGKVLKLPAKDNYKFAYPGEAQDEFYIDCAAGQLNICISSCCHTNCGESFGNWIRGLNVNGSNVIADVGRARQGDIVYKVGRFTGRTKGRIKKADLSIPVDPSLGLPSPKNVIEIEPLEEDCSGVMRFAGEGDSGAAIITEQGNLVGLHYSAALPPNQNNGWACHCSSAGRAQSYADYQGAPCSKQPRRSGHVRGFSGSR